MSTTSQFHFMFFQNMITRVFLYWILEGTIFFGRYCEFITGCSILKRELGADYNWDGLQRS